MPGRFKRWRRYRAEWIALALVALIAVITFVLLMVLARDIRPQSDTALYEVMRVCVQVLGVAVVGFFVGWVTFNLQQARLERQRQADRIRTFRTEMLGAYHGVKQVRRVLRAETTSGATRTITVEAYFRLLQELSKHQLVFETLARSALLIEKHMDGGSAIPVEKAGDKCGFRNKRGTVTESLAGHYGNIESYLNGVISEFERCLQVPPRPEDISLAESGFARTKSFLDDTDEFKAQVSRRVTEILRVLETALLNSA